MKQNAKAGAYCATHCDGCDAEAREGFGFPAWDLGAGGVVYLCRTCWGREGRAHGRRPWGGMVAQPETPGSHVLRYRWSVSKADGYNVITISENGTRYATARGGGYDMTGAALADWMEARYPVLLAQLAEERAASVWSKSENKRTDREGGLYGLTCHADTHKGSMDGACGVSSVCAVLEALGLRFTEDNGNWSKRGRRRDQGIFWISPKA